MGSLSPKKAAAITAAILQHVCDTELLAAPLASPSRSEAARPVFPSLQLWALGGRQQAMQDRLALQRRLGKSW